MTIFLGVCGAACPSPCDANDIWLGTRLGVYETSARDSAGNSIGGTNYYPADARVLVEITSAHNNILLDSGASKWRYIRPDSVVGLANTGQLSTVVSGTNMVGIWEIQPYDDLAILNPIATAISTPTNIVTVKKRLGTTVIETLVSGPMVRPRAACLTSQRPSNITGWPAMVYYTNAGALFQGYDGLSAFGFATQTTTVSGAGSGWSGSIGGLSSYTMQTRKVNCSNPASVSYATHLVTAQGYHTSDMSALVTCYNYIGSPGTQFPSVSIAAAC
jgi:hypothetical protein